MQGVVVDARGHMLGRLASILAKEALSGKEIVSFLGFRSASPLPMHAPLISRQVQPEILTRISWI